MTDEFPLIDGGIKVLDHKGAFQAIKTPAGFTDHTFRQAVAAYDTAYRQYGKTPTITEVHMFWPRIPVKTYSALFVTPEFRQALSYRGIQHDDNTGLSVEQSMLLLALLDPSDSRTLGAKLKGLNIPMARYQAWMNQPLFKQSYFKRSEDQFRDAVPLALNKLVTNADRGDQRAIEKVLEITGRWNPQQQQIEDVKQVVYAVMEAVIRRVADPEVRKAIMDDVESQVRGYALIEQAQLGRGQ